jgi:hypothetical protein
MRDDNGIPILGQSRKTANPSPINIVNLGFFRTGSRRSLFVKTAAMKSRYSRILWL